MSVGPPGTGYQLNQRLSAYRAAMPLKDFVNIRGLRDTSEAQITNPP